MAKLISMTYEQARAEHFKALMKKMERKIDYWQYRGKYSLKPMSELSRANVECSEAGMQYNFYKDALEALEAAKDMNAPAAQPKWISIKDRLPTRELRVLTINGHGLIRIFGFFKRTEKAWTWIDDAGHFNHCNDITHWMPLPSGPKEG